MKEFVKKKAVIVKDRLGLPNYMTMFYMEPGTYNPEDVPEIFKIRNKIVPAILISQYHNTVIDTLTLQCPCRTSSHATQSHLMKRWQPAPERVRAGTL